MAKKKTTARRKKTTAAKTSKHKKNQRKTDSRRKHKKPLMNTTTVIFGLLVIGFIIAMPFLTNKDNLDTESIRGNDMYIETSVVIEEPDKTCEGLQEKRIIENNSNSFEEDDTILDSAKNTNDKEKCKTIVSDSKRDICYMYFVNNNDYSVCDLISNLYVKRSCESLKQIESMSK